MDGTLLSDCPAKYYCLTNNPLKAEFYKTTNKHRNILTNPKFKIENEKRSGIYENNCENCDSYIGQTRRNLNIRFNERFTHIKLDRDENLQSQNMA